MAGRYIPPHLRAKSQAVENTNGTDTSDNSTSASGYAGPSLRGGDRPSEHLTARGSHLDEDLYSNREIEHYFWPDQEYVASTGKTLHDSAASSGNLAYVLLFKDANPRWESDGIIFTKSSLDLLPAELASSPDDAAAAASTSASVSNDDHADTSASDLSKTESVHIQAREDAKWQEDALSTTSTPTIAYSETEVTNPIATEGAESEPIVVFAQMRRSNLAAHRVFKFIGYYRIARLQYLQPKSPELVRMLEQKWTVTNHRTGRKIFKNRDPKGWEESMSMKWAVVKFEKHAEADNERGQPQIEKLEDENGEEHTGRSVAGEKKGVNELLKELRINDRDDDKGEKNDKTAEEKVEVKDKEGTALEQHQEQEQEARTET